MFSTPSSDRGYQLRKLAVFERRCAKALCARYPLRSAFVRVALDRWRIAGADSQILALFCADNRMVGLCCIDLNISLFGFNTQGIALLADYFRAHNIFARSIVGPADNVLPLWDALAKWCDEPREVRRTQWVMRFTGYDDSGNEKSLASTELLRAVFIPPKQRQQADNRGMTGRSAGKRAVRSKETPPHRVTSFRRILRRAVVARSCKLIPNRTSEDIMRPKIVSKECD